MRNIIILLLTLLTNTCFSQNIETFELNDTRTYEVTSTVLPDKSVISVWMEARPEREVSSQIGNVRIAYKISKDFGKKWSEKEIIDDPERFLLGNPYILSNKTGRTFLVFMNVNKDFFSGNLAFYEWSEIDEKFQLKSIPVSSNNSLIDKPSLAIIDNKIYLTYIEYTQKIENSYVKYQYSSDNGSTWSNPKNITNDEIIYLGASLKNLKNNLYLAYGTFWQHKIYFEKVIVHEGTEPFFQQNNPVAEISETLGSAMTELEIDKNGNIAIGWLYNHKPNEVYVSVSENEGKDWKEPLLISKSGNLLSLVFDGSNNLLCLYSEFNDDMFSVILKKVPIDNPTEKTRTTYIKEPTKIKGNRDYIGAFQKITRTKNNEYLIFWIDYSKDNKLYCTKWQDG